MLAHFAARAGCGRPLSNPSLGKQKKERKGVPAIKQVLISLRDPNGIAVRPSGFDCVRRVILSEA